MDDLTSLVYLLSLSFLLAVVMPICAVAALLLTLGTRRSMTALKLRLEALERELHSDVRPISKPAVDGALREAPPEAEPISVPERASPESQNPEPAPPSATSPVPPIAASPSQARGRGFEDRLGSRWAVWVGGLALALGGVFLVRYSIEQNLLAPSVRVTIGLLFALGLIGSAEWLRRKENGIAFHGFSAANVPSVLTAAGTCTAFASIYAAYALYALISPATAFGLLGAVAVLTMVAAILHGPALAGLGLLGAMGSPLLVSSQEPQPWALVIYLPFVVLAAYGVARFRLWRWLALAGAAGALLWSPLIALANTGTILPAMVHIALQTAFAALFLVADPYRRALDSDARIDWMANLVLLLFSLAGLAAASSITAGAERPIFAGILTLVLLATGVRFAVAAPATAIAGLTVVGTLLAWPVARDVTGNAENIFYLSGDIFAVRPEALYTYLIFSCLLVPIVAAASLIRLIRSGGNLPLPVAAWYAGTAAVTPLLALVAAYWRIAGLGRDLSFGLIAALIALAFVFAATRLAERNAKDDEILRLGLGAVSAAALGALALGLTFVLDKGMLTVAFALTALATAWIGERLTIPSLRYAVGAIGLIILGRLIWNPTIVDGDPGPILVNWLLWAYGVPAVSFFLASRWLERRGRDLIVRLTESLSLVFATFLIFFEIRHALHAGYPLAADVGLIEAGLMATETLAFGVLLTRLDVSRPDAIYRWGSMIFKGLSVAICVAGLLIGQNPLLTDGLVQGGLLFNALLPAYLLPSLIAVLLAVAERSSKPPYHAWTSAILALALQLAYVGLQIRRVFHGPEIGAWRGVTQGEQWSYSVALLLIGIALLGIGLLRDIRFARLASAVYLVLAVLKVFIVDLANLEGVMRALSFIGLGLVLIGIGLVYQRLLTHRLGRSAALR